MKVFHGLESAQGIFDGSFVTSIGLGFFDGVHLAHKKIIDNVVKLAKEHGGKSAIITFEKSPIECFYPEKKQKYLTANSQKIEILRELGVDFLYLLDFNSIKEFDGENYVEQILCKNFKPKFITTGFNNHFGKNRSGNPRLLSNLAKKFNYTYFEIPAQKIDGTLISSTKIKQFVKAGDLNSARKFLGRDFEIENTVEAGSLLGRTIGFPTANLIWQDEIVKLPHGVYIGKAKIEDEYENEHGWRKCIINWGSRPTVDKKEILEVHILDFDQNIYGKKLRTAFIEKIRSQIKFENLEQLKVQIKNDCEKARTLVFDELSN